MGVPGARLERFLEDESLRRRAAAARMAALEQELCLPVMLSRSSQFSGIDLGALGVTARSSSDDEGVGRLDSQSSCFFGDEYLRKGNND